MKYDDITLEQLDNAAAIFLYEAMTNDQKEKCQREMAKAEADVFYQLRKYFADKWNKKITTKKEFLQKKKEFEALRYVESLGAELSKASDKDVDNYTNNIIGKKANWVNFKSKNKDEYGALNQNKNCLPYLTLNRFKFSNTDDDGNGFKPDTKELRKNIRKFYIMHEYGHLFEYLKELIEKGSASIVDTLHSDYGEVANSEGKANAYAIDNMYRKDRRELLKNSDLTKENLNKSIKKVNGLIDGINNGDITYSDLYKFGTVKHSKKLLKALNGIQKQEELNIDKNKK